MMPFARSFAFAVLASAVLPVAALAADPEACKSVRMSDPGWTDITSTNAMTATVLEGLGYEPDIKTLAVPIGYQALANKEIDVFLGNWMPAQQTFRDDLDGKKAAEVLNKNLEGAKFTLAVPTYVAEGGVKSFKDLGLHADKFGDKIYGIEAGAPANQNIQKIIDSKDFGLDGWSLVESSEQGMLSQVARAEKSKSWIVFLAWAPHPMNTSYALTYLSGGDDYFGPDFGGAEVYTLGRSGWKDECPNAGKLFSQLTFSVDIENAMMDKILNGKEDAADAAKDWLKEHPDVLDAWLSGVETTGGEPGLAAVKAHLGL